MPIWFNKALKLEDVKNFGLNSMASHLGIQWLEVGENFIKMSMPVDEKTTQPYGILHGGASCVLAETIGSLASALAIDMQNFLCFGLEINANHVKSVSEGSVVAHCLPLHLGKTTHVWDIKINNLQNQLVCVCRLTVAIVPITEKTRSLAALKNFQD